MSATCLPQKLAVDGLEWKKVKFRFDEEFSAKGGKDKDSDKGYILKIDFEYPKELHDLHNDLSFLLAKMKIDKYEKLVCNL